MDSCLKVTGLAGLRIVICLLLLYFSYFASAWNIFQSLHVANDFLCSSCDWTVFPDVACLHGLTRWGSKRCDKGLVIHIGGHDKSYHSYRTGTSRTTWALTGEARLVRRQSRVRLGRGGVLSSPCPLAQALLKAGVVTALSVECRNRHCLFPRHHQLSSASALGSYW